MTKESPTQADRKHLSPGPARVLCGSPRSPEYEVFLSRFCNAHREKGSSEHWQDLGIPEVRSLVKHVRERAECVQSSVVGTLCNELEVIVIVARSDLHSELFVQQGGIEAVTAAMSAYIAFSEIQINGCRALINMSKGFSSMGVTYSCGALRPVIEAMVEHKDDDEVQEKGCWAIGALVKANPETKMQAGEWGGCEAVCQALRDYSGHEAMQQVGLWAMGSLSANNGENSGKLGRAGGVVLCINAMRNFCTNPTISDIGCWVLANMAACNSKCNEYIQKKEGPQAIIAAMRQHPKHPGVQYTGVSALSHLGSDAATQKILSLPAFALFQ